MVIVDINDDIHYEEGDEPTCDMLNCNKLADFDIWFCKDDETEHADAQFISLCKKHLKELRDEIFNA